MSELVDASGNPVVEEEVIEEETVEEEVAENTHPAPEDVNCGFMVGSKKDGELFFEVFGEQPKFLELIGLHKYADYKLNVAMDSQEGYGAALIAAQMQQMQQILKVMLNMLTEQSKATLLSK